MSNHHHYISPITTISHHHQPLYQAPTTAITSYYPQSPLRMTKLSHEIITRPTSPSLDWSMTCPSKSLNFIYIESCTFKHSTTYNRKFKQLSNPIHIYKNKIIPDIICYSYLIFFIHNTG